GVLDRPRRRGRARRLGRDRGQSGLGDRRSESEQKGECEKPKKAAALRQCERERLTEREERELQSVDEQGEADDDEHRPLEEPEQIRGRLAQHDELKKEDDDDAGGEIPQAPEQHSPKKRHEPPKWSSKNP